MKPIKMTKIETETFVSKEFLIILTFPMWTAKYNFEKAFLKRNSKLPISICYSNKCTKSGFYHYFFDPSSYKDEKWASILRNYTFELRDMQVDFYCFLTAMKEQRKEELAKKRKEKKAKS